MKILTSTFSVPGANPPLPQGTLSLSNPKIDARVRLLDSWLLERRACLCAGALLPGCAAPLYVSLAPIITTKPGVPRQVRFFFCFCIFVTGCFLGSKIFNWDPNAMMFIEGIRIALY